ncbi:phosphotransferase [Actinoplanes sp. NPDC051494]|uniref:phosphotransferase n=1 Tax=Actinoplanes sp. NPDC051494 TaxID=3363907 RepID=UPI003794BA9F
MNRIVTVVLADTSGEVLGALPAFETEVPWWQEVGDVVSAVRARHGLDVTVLRLLGAGHEAPPGGPVTYLAQVAGPVTVALTPFTTDASPDPSRAPWAVPGGPAASMSWALSVLPDVAATQVRTWNLSALWRLEAGGQPVAWLKQIPAFLTPEPAVLRLVAGFAPALVPEVLATGDEGRSLLTHVPGEDGYGAGTAFRAGIAADLHPVQDHFAGRLGELLRAGVPDRRAGLDRITRAAAPWLDHVRGLDDLLDELPARLAAVAACGLPPTLVHGDLHPGNVRARPDGSRVIVDWGDSFVGDPAFDILRLTEDVPAEAPELISGWAARWRESVPGCDPQTAVELIRPVARLRAAAQYQDFLDHIEDAERPYHENDVPECLHAAVEAARPRHTSYRGRRDRTGTPPRGRDRA